MTQQHQSSDGDLISANIDDNATNIVVGKDINSVNISGNVFVDNGDFIGRDKVIEGDEVHGNKTTYIFNSQENIQNRQGLQFLHHKVRKFWIDGVLQNSLFDEYIRLNKENHPDSINNRLWDLVTQKPVQSDKEPLIDTDILTVFDKSGQRLLIMGEPGSGKTSTLLELAKALLDKAEKDPLHPTPVIFNLSSWSRRKQPFAEWLMDEFQIRYKIGSKITKNFIENDALLLLLDGLDEVQEVYRETCVIAINQFIQDHIVPIVVCSRVTEYEALKTRLNVEAAILLRPFTTQQVTTYLNRAGEKLAALRVMLHEDSELRRMAETPLILNIMMLAYHGISITKGSPSNAPQRDRQHVFDAYIRRMLQHGESRHQYSQIQIIRWLHRFAVNQHGQTLIDVQSAWMNPGDERGMYYGFVILFIGVIGGIIGGIFGWVVNGVTGALLGAILYSLLYGLGFGLLFEVVMTLRYSKGQNILQNAQRLIQQTLQGNLFSETTGEGPVIKLEWSWNKLKREGLTDGVLFGLAFGTIFTTLIILKDGLVSGLIDGIVYGLIIGLLGGILSGLVPVFTDFNQPNTNNIHRSAKNGIIASLIAGLPAGAMVGAVFGPVIGIFSSLLFALFLGLGFGLLAYCRYFVHHLILWQRGHVPWNYARFLDCCVKCVFLRKVGNDYIFVHRLLMTHFAQMTEKDMDMLASGIQKNM